MSLSKGKRLRLSLNMPYYDLFLQSVSTDRKSEGLEPKPMATYALAESLFFFYCRCCENM